MDNIASSIQILFCEISSTLDHYKHKTAIKLKCKQRMFNKTRISGSPSDWSQYKTLKKPPMQQACREAHTDHIFLG